MLVIRLSSPVADTVKVKRIAMANADKAANVRLRMIYSNISIVDHYSRKAGDPRPTPAKKE